MTTHFDSERVIKFQATYANVEAYSVGSMLKSYAVGVSSNRIINLDVISKKLITEVIWLGISEIAIFMISSRSEHQLQQFSEDAFLLQELPHTACDCGSIFTFIGT